MSTPPRTLWLGMPEHEEWRPIPGHEGYDVSSFGRFRSWRRDGAGFQLNDRARPLNVVRSENRNVVRLSGPNRRQYRAYKLVALAFLGPMPEGATLVRHLNDIKTDDRVGNLAYGTDADNSADALRNGIIRPRTHCRRGHEFTPENTRLKSTGKQCRTCQAESDRRRRAAGRKAVSA